MKSFQDIADSILDTIIDGRLKAGDRLPFEIKPKDMVTTSRGP
jgi:DNA-binding GntR family transcriptional regulator